MKVLKFGGTSVGTVQSLKNVKKIVEAIPGRTIVVVSALGGLTDKLIETAKKASQGDPEWEKEIESITARHYDIIDNVVPANLQEEVKQKIKSQLLGLKRNYEGLFLLRSWHESVVDVIVSFGERMSSVILAAMVENGKRYFSPDFIKTEKWYGKNIADKRLTDSLIRETFAKMGDDEKAIVPGFISKDTSTGAITNLGRGGSDYTGALIAAALDADSLEIWTDVDGFMTADPRIVKDAIIIDHLTFSESMELCTFGAKVIYPPTIFPVFHKNIPIKILNTFNPTAPGTLITDHAKGEDLSVKGVTALKGVSLISFEIKSNDIEDPLKRTFNTLSRQPLKIIRVANPNPTSELHFAILSSDSKVVVDMLGNEFAPDINQGLISDPRLKENLAAVALVGKDMKNQTRLAARIENSLQRQGINVEAFSADSDTTLIFIISQDNTIKALPLIHSLIY